MSADWSQVRLEDAGTWLSGGTPRTSNSEYWGGDIPWISAKSLTAFHLNDSDRRVTQLGAENGTRIVPRGAIIMVVRGMSLKTEFRMGITGRPLAFGQDCKALIAGPDIDPMFLAYAIRARSDEILDLVDEAGHGTGRLQMDLLHDVVVSVPSIDVQKEIAATAGLLDDRYDNLAASIAIAEALGAGLLRSELSVDEFGEPTWSDEPLGDFLTCVEAGARPKGGVGGISEGVVSLGAENIQSAGVIRHDRFKRVPAEFAASMRRGKLEDGDILVYKDGGTPGNFIPHVSAFGYGFPVVEAVINEHVFRVRAGNDVSQGLLYWVLRSPWLDQGMRVRGTGAAIPGMNSSNFKSLPFPELSSESLDRLNNRLEPLLEFILRAGVERARIAALRESVLPELVTGRIATDDAAWFEDAMA